MTWSQKAEVTLKSGLKVLSLRRSIKTVPILKILMNPFDFWNNLKILPRIGKHVLLYHRGLKEKEEVQGVTVLDKRYDTDVYSLVKSGQIPSSEEVRPTGANFLNFMSTHFCQRKTSMGTISIGQYLNLLWCHKKYRIQDLFTERNGGKKCFQQTVFHNNRLNNDHTRNNPSFSLLSASLGYAHCKSDCTCV